MIVGARSHRRRTMFCPYCQHEMDDVRCPKCYKTFNEVLYQLLHELESIVQVDQVVYLRNRLEEWVQRGFFMPEAVEVVLAETAQELATLHVHPGVHTSAAPPPREPHDAPDPS